MFSPQNAETFHKTKGLNGELIPKMKEEPEDEKVDYLEGLTTDMFGDDKEFERCWSDPDPAFMNHHEEALPDAFYGLLGSSRGLSHSQGYMDVLPEEVLMLVLSLLPSEDLYCNVSLVCQRWRNIITQSLKEIDALKEINAILETHRIKKNDQESILHIVEFMAQYKPSQRVKPGAVLQSPAPSEYLSAMTTMLLAMRRTDINISNRWHYNIYVLHLMENALPTAITNQSGPVQVTHKQQQILNHDIHRDHVVKIMAFAGTGKTTTLIRYAQQRPHLHFLYMTFKMSVATQAQRCFPSNVDCRTVHSMAFGAVCLSVGIDHYQELKKLSSNVKPFSVAWVLPKGSGGFVNAKVVTLTLNAYMASANTHITPNHIPNTYKNTHGTVGFLAHYVKVGFQAHYVKVGFLARYFNVGFLAHYVNVGFLACYVKVGLLARYVNVGFLAHYVKDP
ncbi:F-box DNA helicase 1-like [Salmo salar]|uniref:F-box DNA helicase 1-like n=1 Tax=Salmo salar TaxID=8030 RepID=A0ABM3D714_SALSA|nr:F-box DNA helicase 1-like [Salmo salar]